MKIKEMSIEELQSLSYHEVALLILKEENKPMSTAILFKKIADIFELTEAQYERKIEDFFATLTTDKNFILLEDGNWDLKSNHVAKIIKDDDYEEEEIEEEPLEEYEEDEKEEDFSELDELDDSDDILEEDDGLGDLTVLTEEEIEE